MNDFNLPKLNFPASIQSLHKTNEKKDDFKDDKTKDFDTKLKKVSEVKIYLKENFQKSNINETFVKKLEQEYANQFLEKLGLPATTYQIEKLLINKPFEKCDFQLNVETILKKNVKVLHIFPNISTKRTNMTIQQALLSNSQFENVITKTSQINKESFDEKLATIKKKPIKKEEMLLFQPEIVENMINKAKEQWEDKKLSYESHGLIEQQVKGFDLSIENIKKKYINHQYIDENGELKTRVMDKNITKREIIDNDKLQFPYLDINLNKEILKEVNKPLEVPMEVIMKDINYILDNFPIDKLLNVQEPIKNNNDLNSMDDINSNNKNNKAMSSLHKRLKSVSKKDILYAYKKMQSPHVYRIIGLLVNLIYWIVFGFINKVQVNKNTKQQILLKILEEMLSFEGTFKNKIKFQKIFMPVFILIIRIESEAIFVKKFKVLFIDKKSEIFAVEKINDLITNIFDPNLFFSTFNHVENEQNLVGNMPKKNKTLNPNYKTRINVTSILINQLFSTFTNEMNVKKFLKVYDATRKYEKKELNNEELELDKKYIMENKVEFYRAILNKINNNLKKRNMDPIFKISKNNI